MRRFLDALFWAIWGATVMAFYLGSELTVPLLVGAWFALMIEIFVYPFVRGFIGGWRRERWRSPDGRGVRGRNMF